VSSSCSILMVLRSMGKGAVKPGHVTPILLTQPKVSHDLIETTKELAELLGISLVEGTEKSERLS
jgi:hypothetical protein